MPTGSAVPVCCARGSHGCFVVLQQAATAPELRPVRPNAGPLRRPSGRALAVSFSRSCSSFALIA